MTTRHRSVWLNRYLRFMVLATLFLIVAGGLVTSQDYGLAVPDWPKSYGMWFPPMIGGVFYEHGHRMIASFVGFLTVVLTAWLWLKEPRKGVRLLGAGALLLVIVQGIFGGITVLYFLPTWVSTVHATLAQTFFCLIVGLTVLTSSGWIDADKNPSRVSGPNPTVRFAVTAALIFIQLVLGSWMRHSNAALAIPDFPLAFGKVIPDFTTPEIAIHFSHRVGALIVLVFTLSNFAVVLRTYKTEKRILRPVVLSMILVLVQITLGAFTIWKKTAVVVATSHVVVGAVILATSLLITLRSYRLFSESRNPAPTWEAMARTA